MYWEKPLQQVTTQSIKNIFCRYISIKVCIVLLELILTFSDLCADILIGFLILIIREKIHYLIEIF